MPTWFDGNKCCRENNTGKGDGEGGGGARLNRAGREGRADSVIQMTSGKRKGTFVKLSGGIMIPSRKIRKQRNKQKSNPENK